MKRIEKEAVWEFWQYEWKSIMHIPIVSQGAKSNNTRCMQFRRIHVATRDWQDQQHKLQ